jgi:predicted metal-dependent phosphoesterase TrpH
MIDLHTHSSASDGELNPAQLVEKAAGKGIKALALTDHDTISGLEEAENASKSHKICLIPGVELEIQAEFRENNTENKENSVISGPTIHKIGGEFHLLGLGISPKAEELLSALDYQAKARERRNREMVEKIREAGIPADYEEIKAFAGQGPKLAGRIIGRPHFGAFLISRKIVKNQEQAFKRWLGKGKPFYIPKESLDFSVAVRLIHEAGGVAILAHPLSLYVSWGRLPGLLALLKEKGLDGIEAWHPNARVRDCKRLEELGRSLGLLITAGSDFHGAMRPERKLGVTAGDRKIGDEFLAGIPLRGAAFTIPV